MYNRYIIYDLDLRVQPGMEHRQRKILCFTDDKEDLPHSSRPDYAPVCSWRQQNSHFSTAWAAQFCYGSARYAIPSPKQRQDRMSGPTRRSPDQWPRIGGSPNLIPSPRPQHPWRWPLPSCEFWQVFSKLSASCMLIYIYVWKNLTSMKNRIRFELVLPLFRSQEWSEVTDQVGEENFPSWRIWTQVLFMKHMESFNLRRLISIQFVKNLDKLVIKIMSGERPINISLYNN